MSKTVTIRLDEEAYSKIRAAAEAERRPISNYIEHATLSYLEQMSFVSDEEMSEILSDSDLLRTLQRSLEDVKRGAYRIVE
jgi:predicted transcriptional regulator